MYPNNFRPNPVQNNLQYMHQHSKNHPNQVISQPQMRYQHPQHYQYLPRLNHQPNLRPNLGQTRYIGQTNTLPLNISGFRSRKDNISTKSQTWSEIQKILAKPVYFPENISINFQGNRHVSRQTRYEESNSRLHNARSFSPRMRNVQAYREEYSPVRPPQAQSRIQYIPYTKKYYEYEPKEIVEVIYVPVQRQVTQYYTIEHVTEYMEQQFEETVIEYIPEQRMHMKIEYIPIQQQILYVPEDNFNNQQNRQLINHTNQVRSNPIRSNTSQLLKENNNNIPSSGAQTHSFATTILNPTMSSNPPLSPRKVQFGQPIQRNQKIVNQVITIPQNSFSKNSPELELINKPKSVALNRNELIKSNGQNHDFGYEVNIVESAVRQNENNNFGIPQPTL